MRRLKNQNLHNFKNDRRLHCRTILFIVAIGIFKRLTIQSRELLIIWVCHEEAQEEHSLSMISRDMFTARLRRSDVSVDDSIDILEKDRKKRRYERRSRSQTLQPDVTTSSLLG